MRLKDKVAIVVGAGQTPGETIGNGRATCIVFGREQARQLLVDIDRESAEETSTLVKAEAPAAECEPFQADVTKEEDCAAMIRACIERFGRLDVLHYNVGKSQGDSEASTLPIENWDAIMDLNLRGFYLCCKHALPVMRKQESGVITGISSAAAITAGRNMTYTVSKAGMNALMRSLAIDNGRYGIRVNTIMPGLMDTPMAIERRAREQNRPRAEIRAARARQVPLKQRQGTAWDVANAALFLASDEASYVTGIALPVDGGLTAR
jgi:NAD(P)-dependent dehydrogenase (short-subunit alcohol dehydrogenase family)